MKRHSPELTDKGLLFIVYIALIGLVILLHGCSSVRKSQTKSSSNVDSVSVQSSSIETKKDSAAYKRIDSIGSIIKDRSKESEVTTIIEFEDSVVSVNGNASDYSVKGKIKKITVYDKSKKASKETQTAHKASEEKVLVNASQVAKTSDSSHLKKSETVVTKDKKKSASRLWWLGLLIVAGLFIVTYINRKSIKNRIFGGR